MSHLVLEFVPHRKTESGEWVELNEFVFRVPPEEMATAYAAHCIRLRCLAEAEDNLKNYIHPEPMKLEGKIKTVEIKSAVEFLKRPILTTMTANTGTPDAMTEIQRELPQRVEWRTKKETGLQLLASIGWLAALTKAKPPEITTDTSSVDYSMDLLPSNLEVKNEATPSGYNKSQVKLLQEAMGLVTTAVNNCGSLHDRLSDMTVITFGQLLFKTQSRLFGALPDPEAEEREKFETMRQAAAAAAAAKLE